MLSDTEGLTRREDLESSRKSIIKRRRIILFSILGAVALFIIFLVLYHFTNIMFGVSEDLESAPQNGDWVMFRRDQAHTGSTDAAVSPDGTLKWTFMTGAAIHSSPAVVNGVVYFGSRDNYIYALDAQTGQELWSFKTGSWVDSSPAVAGGRVYFGSDDYRLYAVDALTGKELWNLKTNNMVLSSPVVTKGIVVVCSMDGSCYAVNAENGRHRLDFRTDGPIGSSPAVDNGVAYFTSSIGQLIAVDTRARNWLLENKLIGYWKTLYIYGVAPRPPVPSGFLWSLMLGSEDKVGSSPAVRDGTIYLGSGSSLMSLEIADGKINWTFDAEGWILSSPAVTDDAVYFGIYDGHLYALDRATGAKLWDALTGNIITSSPAVADGTVYVGSEDGKLYAFD
jgi:eukaryotic-like serine/threonine-protein kinase